MTPIHIAVLKKDIKIVKLLLDQKNIDINIKDNILYYYENKILTH